MFSPYHKAIKAIQEEYAENSSVQIRLTKAELNDILYTNVSTVLSIVSNARRMLIDKNLMVWSTKQNFCTINLEEIKKVKT